jgi:hypothetical protein
MLQADEKYPSAAFSSSFVVAAYTKYASLLTILDALHLGLFDQPENLFTCQIELPQTVTDRSLYICFRCLQKIVSV